MTHYYQMSAMTSGELEYDSGPVVTEPRVLTIISNVMERLVSRNDWLVASYGERGKKLEGFKGLRAPSISIPKYLERIFKYTNCSPSCLVMGYVYIDRLAHKYPSSLIISLNVHRLLITSIMVASKMFDDVHYNNALYAKIGGVSNKELNKMELDLLFLLDFGVTVCPRVFETYCFHLEKDISLNAVVSSVELPFLHNHSTTLETFSSVSSFSSLLAL